MARFPLGLAFSAQSPKRAFLPRASSRVDEQKSPSRATRIHLELLLVLTLFAAAQAMSGAFFSSISIG